MSAWNTVLLYWVPLEHWVRTKTGIILQSKTGNSHRFGKFKVAATKWWNI